MILCWTQFSDSETDGLESLYCNLSRIWFHVLFSAIPTALLLPSDWVVLVELSLIFTKKPNLPQCKLGRSIKQLSSEIADAVGMIVLFINFDAPTEMV